MAEDTPQTTPDSTQVVDAGTSQDGQAQSPAVETKGTPNDPVLMREDYTRKTQELAREREMLAQEKSRLELERQALLRHQPSYNQYQQPAYQQPVDPLAEQFGYDGANAVNQKIEAVTQTLTQQVFNVEYARQEEKGQQKYGEAWNKFDYVDPMTNTKHNQVMDLRLKGLSLEQAWNALNPVDPAVIEQQARDKIYQEIQNKASNTPASGNAPKPANQGTGHARTTAEAFNMAEAMLKS